MKKLLLLTPIIIYVGASTWATLDLFPEGFMEYWWFDDVMHVLVFGAVALSLAYVARHYLDRWLVGIAGAAVLAIADEIAQVFLPARSFTLQDLAMSLVGVAIAGILYALVSRR